MTTRRDVLVVLAAGALTVPRAESAQQPTLKIPRVGYLFSFTPAEGRHLWAACQQGLRELGYVEGRNIVLEPRWTDGHYDRLKELTAELVRLKVDVLVVVATPGSIAAKAATKTIPIVIVAVSDPVRIGLVANIVRPGGNLTGLSLLTPELSGKRLELLASLAGAIPRVGALLNPRNASHAIFLEETRAAAQRLGVQLQPLEAANPEELDRAFSALIAGRGTALIVFDDPVLWSYRPQIVALAASRRVPVMYGYREYVDEGGLISYGPDRIDLYRRTAGYVDKILKGAKPAALPIEQPTKFELVINLRTAKSLGLTVPQALLISADKVIE